MWIALFCQCGQSKIKVKHIIWHASNSTVLPRAKFFPRHASFQRHPSSMHSLSTDEVASLFAAAQAARSKAHAPYSRYVVGAAVLDENGQVHAGCNVENAAYPQGWCAETTALGAMVMAGGRHLRAVLVAGPGPLAISPCGGCRQKLREFGADAVPVLSASPTGVVASWTLGELLPASFGPEHLS
jgi:cytidine deaminase